MIRLIKNNLFGKYIRSKKYTDTHPRATRSYDEIKQMAFLLDGSDPIALRLLLNRIAQYRKQGIKISLLGYVRKLPPFQEEGIRWITKKDLSWIGIPKTRGIKHFIEQRFDVLINTAMQSLRPLEYISTYSKAALRIGKFSASKTYCYDFMLHFEGQDAEAFLDQVDHYLQMVKT